MNVNKVLTKDYENSRLRRRAENKPNQTQLFRVDHINHNGLDNRKKNLRLCTQAQNIYNSLPRRNCSSKYKGVYLHKRTNRYLAAIRYKGKRFHLGTFKNQVDAAKAYDKKAKELFGEFAYLNFPDCHRDGGRVAT